MVSFLSAHEKKQRIKEFGKIRIMASYDVLHVTCPVCNTDLMVKISYGIYPTRSIETADCPVLLM